MLSKEQQQAVYELIAPNIEAIKEVIKNEGEIAENLQKNIDETKDGLIDKSTRLLLPNADECSNDYNSFHIDVKNYIDWLFRDFQ